MLLQFSLRHVPPLQRFHLPYHFRSKALTDLRGRHPGHNTEGRYIFGHHRSAGDHRPVSYSDVSHDNRIMTNPYIMAYTNLFYLFQVTQLPRK